MPPLTDSRLYLRDDELDQSVGLILMAQRQLQVAAEEARKAAGLSQSELDVLLGIRNFPGRTVNELRAQLFMTVPTFARLLGQLEGRALVRKKKSREDGRSRQLYLSEAGLSLIEPVVEALRGRLKTAYRIAGAENVAGARATLDALMGDGHG
jgi:DNA-binding MarR family transcriptional regulator